MIPNILSTIKGYGKGYLVKSDASAMIQPMLPAANLAIRRTALDEVGPFDTACKTSGEDNDLCIRMLKTDWELFYEERAVVGHKHRASLKGLLKQWYGYGTYHPHIFKKHTPKCLEVVYHNDRSMLSWTSRRFHRILGMPVPCPMLVFVTPFHILHALLGLVALAWLMGAPVLSAVAALSGLGVWLYFSAGPFVRNCIRKRDLRWFPFAVIRYMVNWVFVFAAFRAGLKIGVIYIAATRAGESH